MTQNHWKQISWSWKTYYLDGWITSKPSKHHWKQWSEGLKTFFYGDDLSCRSTHKGLMWILDSPVAIQSTSITLFGLDCIDHWYTPTQKVAQHLHRQGAGSMPYLPTWGYFSPSKRGSSKERGCRQDGEAVEGEEKGQLDGKPAGARIGEESKMLYNV